MHSTRQYQSPKPPQSSKPPPLNYTPKSTNSSVFKKTQRTLEMILTQPHYWVNKIGTLVSNSKSGTPNPQLKKFKFARYCHLWNKKLGQSECNGDGSTSTIGIASKERESGEQEDAVNSQMSIAAKSWPWRALLYCLKRSVFVPDVLLQEPFKTRLIPSSSSVSASWRVSVQLGHDPLSRIHPFEWSHIHPCTFPSNIWKHSCFKSIVVLAN